MQSILLIACLFMLGCAEKKYDNPHVLIQTHFGEIELEVYPQQTPQTVAAFFVNIEKGVYNNSTFYRVLKSEDMPSNVNTGLIQGGVYKSGNNIQVKAIPHETTQRSGLTHTDGTISMARTEPGTATTEFFICIGDQSPLDSGRRGTPDGLGMAAFGRVFKGMSVVRRIQSQENNGDAFKTEITIRNIRKL